MLPPNSILRGARRWLEHLATSDTVRVQAVLTSHAGYADLTATQYFAALRWLRNAGLVTTDGRPVFEPQGNGSDLALLMLEAAIACAKPMWLFDADELIHSAAELPMDAVAAGAELGLDKQTTLAAIRAAFGKIDLAMRERLGTLGETLLLDLIVRFTRAEARRVSLISDGYGYDIEVNPPSAAALHLEVKTTGRRSKTVIYLTRNEYETMTRDSHWLMVVVSVSGQDTLEAIHSVDPDWILTAAPMDQGVQGSWAVARLQIPPEALRPGICGLSLPTMQT